MCCVRATTIIPESAVPTRSHRSGLSLPGVTGQLRVSVLPGSCRPFACAGGFVVVRGPGVVLKRQSIAIAGGASRVSCDALQQVVDVLHQMMTGKAAITRLTCRLMRRVHLDAP